MRVWRIWQSERRRFECTGHRSNTLGLTRFYAWARRSSYLLPVERLVFGLVSASSACSAWPGTLLEECTRGNVVELGEAKRNWAASTPAVSTLWTITCEWLCLVLQTC